MFGKLLRIIRVPRRPALRPGAPADGPVFAVGPSGCHIFKYADGRTLLCRYRALIGRLRFALDAPEQIWDEAAMPLIASLASTISSLPASEAVHDPDAGGLFRHSLLTALNAMEGMDSGSAQDSFRPRLCVMMLALMHDLGKPISDYEVSDVAGRIWDPLKERLDDFMDGIADQRICVSFNKGRRRVHANLRYCMALLLFRDCLGALSFTRPFMEPEELFDQESPLCAIVREADSYSAYSQSSRGSAIASLPDYLRADLASRALQGALVFNTPDAEAFAGDAGVLLQGGGTEIVRLRAIVRNLNLMQEGSDFEAPRANPLLVTSGFYELKGPRRFLSWHRVDLEEETVYVKGAMVRMSLPEEVRRVNIIDRGMRPPELDAIIRAHGMRSCGDLCRIRFKERPPISGEIDPEQMIEGSLRYDSHKSAPLEAGSMMDAALDGKGKAKKEPAFPMDGALGSESASACGASADAGDEGEQLKFSEAGGITSAAALRASQTRQGLKALCAELLRSRR